MKDIAAENPEICAKWRGRIEEFLAGRGLKPPLEFPEPNYPPIIPGMNWLEKSEVGKQMLP